MNQVIEKPAKSKRLVVVGARMSEEIRDTLQLITDYRRSDNMGDTMRLCLQEYLPIRLATFKRKQQLQSVLTESNSNIDFGFEHPAAKELSIRISDHNGDTSHSLVTTEEAKELVINLLTFINNSIENG